MSVFWPLSPMKFVFMFGTSAIVPPSTRRAASNVAAGRRSVQWMTGRYPRCSRVGCASSSSAETVAPARRRDRMAGSATSIGVSAGSVAAVPSAAAATAGWRVSRPRNQYASTGTMVRATKRDAPSAMVTVRANGRNSSPVMSLTSASGRNTATVVTVDAVTAVATSRTAAVMARTFVSPRVRCRLMFSMTTMESSTTRPIAIVSAPSVMMLSV